LQIVKIWLQQQWELNHELLKYNRGPVHFAQMIIKEEGKISCCFKHAVEWFKFLQIVKISIEYHMHICLLDLLADTRDLVLRKWDDISQMFIGTILIVFGFKTLMLLWFGYTFFAARLSNIAEFEACWWTLCCNMK
jgi:hypothetical protein